MRIDTSKVPDVKDRLPQSWEPAYDEGGRGVKPGSRVAPRRLDPSRSVATRQRRLRVPAYPVDPQGTSSHRGSIIPNRDHQGAGDGSATGRRGPLANARGSVPV